MMRCSGKAFFESGHSIGWDAIEDLGDDAKTARKFVEYRVLSQAIADEKVVVVIKEKLGAPVRSSFDFELKGLQAAQIISQIPSQVD